MPMKKKHDPKTPSISTRTRNQTRPHIDTVDDDTESPALDSNDQAAHFATDIEHNPKQYNPRTLQLLTDDKSQEEMYIMALSSSLSMKIYCSS